MPVLPIPLIIALLLAGLLLHRLATRETHSTLLALIGACAVQAALIALVQYYGFGALRPLQPIGAMLIPPLAWIAFAWAAGGTTELRIMVWHAVGPVLAIIVLLVNPFLLDAIIPVSFVGYGLLILLRLWRGADGLLHSRLDGGAISLLVWRIIGLSLIASAACDVMIAYGLAFGKPSLLNWIPSIVSSLSLLSLGALSLTNAMESRRELEPEEPVKSQEEIARDQTIVARLDDFMLAQKPYLDPDLTLARLSRKLVLPAKQVSAAINRVKGENVSRYINQLRIEEACRKLATGQSITSTMLDSGFNTKSNFNREFLRVKGMSPKYWLASIYK